VTRTVIPRAIELFARMTRAVTAWPGNRRFRSGTGTTASGPRWTVPPAATTSWNSEAEPKELTPKLR